MPLYEMVMITKCTTPLQTATLMQDVGLKIYQLGGNVREVKILSDRLLAKQMRAVDGTHTVVGRYAQILLDGSPHLLDKAAKQAKLNENVIKVSFFRIKDFYSYAQQYNKKLNSQISSFDHRKNTARQIAILQEQS